MSEQPSSDRSPSAPSAETEPTDLANADGGDSNEDGSLEKRAVRSSIWTFAGYGSSMVLRLGSNLVLTRLLMPEIFGIMALVSVYLIALELFSDLGINASVIHSERGDDPDFLDTAWTVQVVRGCALSAISVLLAHPVALLYETPELASYLPVASIDAVILGFTSTKLASLNRKLKLGLLTIIEITSQVVSVTVMVAWAVYSPTPWALIAGGLTAAVVEVALSHLAIKGRRNRFRWDKSAIRELVNFGRWIFLSTAFTFSASHGDRPILGTYVSLATLGLYNQAWALANAMTAVPSAIGHRVLFPLYSRLVEQRSAALIARLRKIRLALMGVFLPFAAIGAVYGNLVMKVLYDGEYEGGGWMLQVLSVGAGLEIIVLTISPILLASGKSFHHMLVMIAKAIALPLCMISGGALYGEPGLVVGVVVASLFTYPVLAWAVHQTKTWMPGLDLLGLVFALCVAGLCYLALPWATEAALALEAALEALKAWIKSF